MIKEDKATNKLRVVFNCNSHEVNGLSLNDCLESGENLNPNILELLLHFRENAVAITADIEQAFLQISLVLDDRDAV